MIAPLTTFKATLGLTLSASLLILGACSSSRDTTAATTDDGTEQSLRAHEQRVAELEQKIDELVMRISATGRGAYATGAVLQLDATGSESLLQRLHQLQEELGASRIALEKHLDQLNAVRDSLALARKENEQLRTELTMLQRFRKSVEVTREELQFKKTEIAELNAKLLESQKRRLAIERAYADFARTFLQLEPLHTTEFLDLQGEIRQHVEDLWPSDIPADKHAEIRP
ncbi:MAG: hypothetical protein PF961_22650 [Planctomycetota bacterium]|jgi:chromosome segregation ATPase|nr:hypothetical protein [Planctomycetota bacterium]